MRVSFQILVIPFRCTAAKAIFAVLTRSDSAYWPFVVGGRLSQTRVMSGTNTGG
jgi:hypothetical protein